MKRLYPAFSSQSGSSKGKRKFNPSDECVVASEKRKKKATNTRAKLRTFYIVLLPKKTVYVPKGYAKSRLAKQGRVVKAVFKRNMNSEEVKETVVDAFSAFKLVNFVFLNCGQDNRLKVIDSNDPSGDGIFELAGQGSIYVSMVSVGLCRCMYAMRYSIMYVQSEAPEEEVVVSSDSDEDCKVVAQEWSGALL